MHPLYRRSSTAFESAESTSYRTAQLVPFSFILAVWNCALIAFTRGSGQPRSTSSPAIYTAATPAPGRTQFILANTSAKLFGDAAAIRTSTAGLTTKVFSSSLNRRGHDLLYHTIFSCQQLAQFVKPLLDNAPIQIFEKCFNIFSAAESSIIKNICVFPHVERENYGKCHEMSLMLFSDEPSI